MRKSARAVESVSDTEIYCVNDTPFPVRERDIVAHVKWSYEQDTGKISMRSDATPARLPKKKGLVRIQHGSSEWHFTPLGDGYVKVENYAHIDPNGRIPAWLINCLIVESPHKTQGNMRRLVLDGSYSDAEVAFVSNKNIPPGAFNQK
jgi:hypothetical protein